MLGAPLALGLGARGRQSAQLGVCGAIPHLGRFVRSAGAAKLGLGAFNLILCTRVSAGSLTPCFAAHSAGPRRRETEAPLLRLLLSTALSRFARTQERRAVAALGTHRAFSARARRRRHRAPRTSPSSECPVGDRQRAAGPRLIDQTSLIAQFGHDSGELLSCRAARSRCGRARRVCFRGPKRRDGAVARGVHGR